MSPSLSLARSHTMRAHTDMYRHLYMPVVCGYRSCTMRTFHVVLSMHLEMGFGIVLKRSCTLERFHIMEEKRIEWWIFTNVESSVAEGKSNPNFPMVKFLDAEIKV